MAAFLAAVLFPILYMTSGDGPTNLIPFSKQALAKSPLSPENNLKLRSYSRINTIEFKLHRKLTQKTVTGMNGFDIVILGNLYDFWYVQISLNWSQSFPNQI
jgi:hypothetical protein